VLHACVSPQRARNCCYCQQLCTQSNPSTNLASQCHVSAHSMINTWMIKSFLLSSSKASTKCKAFSPAKFFIESYASKNIQGSGFNKLLKFKIYLWHLIVDCYNFFKMLSRLLYWQRRRPLYRKESYKVGRFTKTI
jgi:hypothetical protein